MKSPRLLERSGELEMWRKQRLRRQGKHFCGLIFLLFINVQKRTQVASSAGWKLYCNENRSDMGNDGLTGNKLVSKLGENWRGLVKEDRNKYQRRAYVLETLKNNQPELQRSQSSKTDQCSSTLRRQNSWPPMC